ncbi:MAG: hypothetical protein IT198_06235 [Acidimicrobiia bacterium]|nr:hypothetical protein [Acidimicrobiia bacterium]
MTATQTSPATTRPDTRPPEYTEIKPADGGLRTATPVKPRRINLLPPEIGRQRAQAKIKFYVFGGVGLLVVLLAALYVLKTMQISAAQEELADQKTKNEALQSQVDDPALQAVVAKQADAQARAGALSGVVTGEVSLPALLNQLSIVIPDGTWLASLNFTGGGGAQAGAGSTGTSAGASAAPTQQAGAAGAPPAEAAAGPIGTLQVNGSGLGNQQMECSHDVSAIWLQTMQAWPAISKVWVSTSTKSGEGLCNVVDFTSDMELSSTLETGRSGRFASSAGPAAPTSPGTASTGTGGSQ